MNELTKKGDWYYVKQKSGMILEVYSKNKFTGETYSIKINAVEQSKVNNELFDLSGFKISDIPEGYNCGLPEKGN